MQTETSNHGKSLANFLFRACVSGVLLWLPLRHVALGSVGHEIAAVQWPALVAALGALMISTASAALRWSIILGVLHEPRGLRVTYPLSLIGVFFGQALPAGAGGDVVRVWLARKTGLTLRAAISSIIGDRATGLLAILIIVTAELPFLHAFVESRSVFYGLVAVLLCGYGAFGVLILVDRLPSSLLRFRAFRGIAGVSADIRATLVNPAIVWILVCSAAIQLLNVLAIFFLAQGLSLPASLSDCLLIVPVVNVVQTIPISIAGWGIRESFLVAAFGSLGIAAPSALAVSLLYGLLFLVSSLPGGVLWLLRGTGSPPEAREIVEPAIQKGTQ